MKKIDNSREKNFKVDWYVTIVPFAVVIIVGIIIAALPDAASKGFWALRNFFVNDLGFTYIIFGILMLIMSIWVSFSKFGRIKLGNLDKPRYSTFSWGAMIFTSTMAADVLYWALIEWAYYYTSDPFGLGAERTLLEVQDLASAYPLFHWGPIGWVFYILPAVVYGYMMFVKKSKKETLSEACRPVLGNHVDGWVGKVIDIFCITGLLAGCATIFSIATPMISGAFCGLTGLPNNKWITIFLLIVVAIVFTLAVLIGMKGIQWVSDKSVYLFIILGAYFFLCGPMRYTVETGITSIGFVTDNFIKMATWMDPLRLSGANGFGFPQDWTIFFWANWISWSVATPMFIGKISEGRTIKGTILGGFAAGISSTFLSFIIFGNYGLHKEVTGALNISGMLNDGATPAAAILEIFKTLPLDKVVMALVIIVMIGLYATTFDATSLVLAGFSQKHRKEGQDPSKGMKIYWSIVLILLPIAMVFAESILTVMQTVSIIAAFPIMVIVGIIMVGFIKDLSAIGVTQPIPPMAPASRKLEDYKPITVMEERTKPM